MASKWNGCTVSVNCIDGLGVYQGLVSQVHPETQTLLLSKPFKNGIPCGEPQIALSAHIIESIKIIENVDERSVPASSTVTVSKPVAKRAQLPVSENIAHFTSGPSLFSSPASSKLFARPTQINESPRKVINEADTFQSALFLNTDKKNPRHKWTERDEKCFGEPLKPHQYMKEFDFEKNLALFDKQAVFQRINAAAASQRPDLVRQADRKDRERERERGPRSDDTLMHLPLHFGRIMVPQSGAGGMEYITDQGVIVPSITFGLREQLFTLAEEADFTFSRQAEIMGRAVTEVAIPLLGGPHRLNPLSTAEQPVVVALCGPHRSGALTVNAARQLASHGVETTVCLSHPTHHDHQLTRELGLYRLTGQRVAENAYELPISGVDLILVGLCDERWPRTTRVLTQWAGDTRATLLGIEPPSQSISGLPLYQSLTAGLPMSSIHKLFLVNLGLPQKVFSQLGIHYRSPFGPKFIIPLHLKK